jgi:hypothetical protein
VRYPKHPTQTAATTQAYRNAAKRVWHDDGQIEIDEDAIVSHSSGSGAYVQAWVWICDDQIELEPGPTYDVWIAEPDDWNWTHAGRFTCEDDPDGIGARRSAHLHARNLRQTYHCAHVAVRPAGNKPLPIKS